LPQRGVNHYQVFISGNLAHTHITHNAHRNTRKHRKHIKHTKKKKKIKHTDKRTLVLLNVMDVIIHHLND